jgi:hypothetical protein
VNVEMHDMSEFSPGVSVQSVSAAVSKVTFPVTADASIVIKALVSPIASMLARVAHQSYDKWQEQIR